MHKTQLQHSGKLSSLERHTLWRITAKVCILQFLCIPTTKPQRKKVKSLSRVWLFATPWHVACQALPSMGFSRQEYWGGLPFPSPGDPPDLGIKPMSPANLPHWRQILCCWATRENPVYFVKYQHLGIPRWIKELIPRGFPGGSVVKNPPANAGDTGSLPGLGRSPGEGNGNPPQYSCLENPMDRRAWRATVHRVARSQTRL